MNIDRVLTAFFLITAAALALSCGSNRVGSVAIDPPPSPISNVMTPADLKEFEIGPFRLLGPPDLKKKNIKGIDSEVYEYENREFLLAMDVSSI